MFWQRSNLFEQIIIDIRLLKESHTDFERKNGPHRGIKISLLQRAIFHQLGQILEIGVAGHIHIEACCQGTSSSFTAITGKTLRDETRNSKGIADDKALESPLAAQDIMH